MLRPHAFLLAAFAICSVSTAATESSPWGNQGVIDTSRSPHAKLSPVPVHAVKLGDGFWAKRMKLNADKGLPIHVEDHEREGEMDNFRRLNGKNVERRGFLWSDEYVYKLMEAMAFVLQTEDRPEMRKKLEELVDTVIAAQQPDGYLNTYWLEQNGQKRLSWMQGSHELYCFGHMVQAAAAYYRATGNRRFIDAATRYLGYLSANYGRDKKPLTDGHPEAEMALVELYRITGDQRALDFAGYLLEGDGARLGWNGSDFERLFSGIPFVSRTKLEGHAVRCLYAISGASDYYAETGDPKYGATLERLWKDLVTHKMYITGGVGSRIENESFGEPYELHNREGWLESCAAIANMMWQYRLLQIKAEGRFADVMERVMYNGMNAGYGVDGVSYCYNNPLELPAQKHRNSGAMCCSPNLNRTIASIPGYFYSTSKDGIYVHLFHNSTLDWHLADGTGLKIVQATEYPWKGDIRLTINPAQAATFGLHVRIPDWSRTAAVTINGAVVRGVKSGEYLSLQRKWEPGDQVRVTLDMKPHVVAAHPLVSEDQGRVAVQRGPLVYTLEHIDQPGVKDFGDVLLKLAAKNLDAGFQVQERPDLLGGVCVLKHKGAVYSPSIRDEPLYRGAAGLRPRSTKPIDLTFIPFYTYANREPSAMKVWVPYQLE